MATVKGKGPKKADAEGCETTDEIGSKPEQVTT